MESPAVMRGGGTLRIFERAPRGLDRSDPEYASAVAEGNGRYDGAGALATAAAQWLVGAPILCVVAFNGLCAFIMRAVPASRPRHIGEAALISGLVGLLVHLAR